MRLLFTILLLAICTFVRGAVPTFESFSDQFQTNNFRVFYRAVHTNDAGIIYPALTNSLSIVTNLNTYGTFSLPSKVELLTLGTNYLDVSTNSTWLLNSPTNDAAQVILSLSAGAYQGQLLFITSQNGSNSFTLPDLSEQWDVPGAYVDIQGDWLGTTNRGIILQYTAPDWIEMARFDPSGGGGGSVFGSGTVGTLAMFGPSSTSITNSPVYTDGAYLSYTNNSASPGIKVFGSGGSAPAIVGLTPGALGVAAQLSGPTGVVFGWNSVLAEFAGTNFIPSVPINLGTPSFPFEDLNLVRKIAWNGTNILSTEGSALVYSNSAITGTGGFYIKDGAGSFRLYMGAAAGQAHLQSSDGSAVVLAANVFGKDAAATMDLGHISSLANQFRDAALSRDLYVGRNIIWNQTTNSLKDTWGQGSPEGVLSAFPGSLYRDALNGAFYGKTNGTGNTGWGVLSAGTGGGGSALWASAGGVLEPSPAIDLVRIESQLADNATNVAFIVDTAVPWTTGNTAEFRNSTTNQTVFFSNGGGVGIGKNAENTDFNGPLTPGTVLRSTHVTSLGDSDTADTLLEAVNDNSYSLYAAISTLVNQTPGFVSSYTHQGASIGTDATVWYITTSDTTNSGVVNAIAEFDVRNVPRTILSPTGSQVGGNPPYLWDTSYAATSGVIEATRNFGTNVFEVYWDGEIAASKPGFGDFFEASPSELFFTTTATISSGNILEVANNTTNKFTVDYLGRLSIQGQTNLFGDNGTAPTFNGNVIGAPVGTMVGSGMTTAGIVPMTTGTSGTNFVASPITGTGTNITVTGNITANSETVTNGFNVLGGQTSVAAGTASLPGLVFGADTTYGFYRNAANQWTLANSSQNRISFIDSIIRMDSSGQLAWTASHSAAAGDLSIVRDGPARAQIGLDAAAPVSPQILGVADGSGTDKNGSDFQNSGGRGTGTGRGGALLGKTSLTTTTGSTAQTESTRYYHSAKFVDLTESTATTFANIALASSKYLGVRLNCTVSAADATDFQAVNSNVSFSAVNKAGTVTVGAVTQNDDATAASAGTLTVTYTAVVNGNGVDIKANAVSSLTQTQLRCKWSILSLNSDDLGTVVAQ